MLSKSYLSLMVQGLFVLFAGLELVLIPNTLLIMVGFEPTTEIWIKVLGVVLMCMSIIYYYLNKYGYPEIIFATVLGRLFASACFGLLVLSGQAQPALMLLAVVDTATAVWTWRELRNRQV